MDTNHEEDFDLARSRNIKPGFFLNDKLAEVEPLGRLLFAGLWTLADREGRLEYRPKKIKAAILPYDKCGVEKLLTALAAGGFIVIYEAGSDKYIQVMNWRKHQNPHYKEVASEIPAPSEDDLKSVQHRGDVDSTSSQPCTLIPDSGFLIPDSLSCEDGAFDTFWKQYPRRVGRKAAQDKWKATLKKFKDVTPDTLITAARNYASSCQRMGTEERYIKHPATFLGPQEPWRDYLTAPQQPPEPRRFDDDFERKTGIRLEAE